MIGVTLGIFLLGIVLFAGDYYASTQKIEGGLVRNEYGDGDRTEELKVKNESGETAEVEVEVSERQYSESETQKMFDRCITKMEKKILGENDSYDRIETDMNLVTELSGEEVDISWELDRYDVMNVYGELKEDQLVADGTMVNLRATLTYRANQKAQAAYECSVMVYPENAEEGSFTTKVLDAIRKNDDVTKTENKLPLPEEVNGKKVQYFYQMDSRGLVILAMAVLIGVLLLALEKQNLETARKERKQQMISDYPEIINKLTLLLGAGMIVRRAWKKMVDDYEEQKERWGTRHAYEEMKQTMYEMESGISEAESYERFGRRCNIQEYMKLGALLSQNLRKGTKGLSQILKIEAIQAFEERKARAKRLGEEAGTKLLLPMFLMLSVVLIIVIVPAFLSIQL